MRQIAKIIILTLLWLAPQTGSAIDDSCECPKHTCNAECEIEQSVTFYSEKCAGGSRVKSCARPTCIAIPDAPKHCGMAQIDQPKPSPQLKAKVDEPTTRMPASEQVDNVVGEIGITDGAVWRAGGEKKIPLQRGDLVREGDLIETDEAGKAQVLFKSGNILNVAPSSSVRISEMTDHVEGHDKRRAVLDLLKGKIRNKVKANYKGEQSYYRVKVGAAVAGVRGTDFVVSVQDSGENLISRVETLSGKVELSDHMFESKILVAKNEGATFVAPKKSIFDAKEKAEFAAKGYLTPLYKLSAEDIAKINSDTSVEVAASKVKSKNLSLSRGNSAICANPQGALNQCVWTCEGNPSGEKRCRTDLPSVSCVRRICNANGNWSEPTRLPAAYRDHCEATRAIVRPCDY